MHSSYWKSLSHLNLTHFNPKFRDLQKSLRGLLCIIPFIRFFFILKGHAMHNQTLKAQLNKEFMDFISLIIIFFASIVIFALVGCLPIAAISLVLIYIVAFAYSTRWLYLGALALYKSLKSQHERKQNDN